MLDPSEQVNTSVLIKSELHQFFLSVFFYTDPSFKTVLVLLFDAPNFPDLNPIRTGGGGFHPPLQFFALYSKILLTTHN